MRASVSSNMGLSMPETLPCLRSKSLIPAYNTGMGRIVAIFNTVGTGRDLSVQYDQSVKHNLDRSINCILIKIKNTARLLI